MFKFLIIAKQWSGLIKDYYLPRWQLFFNYLALELIDPGHFTYNQEQFVETFMEEIGIPFTFSTKEYPNEPSGDTLALVLEAYEEWRPKLENYEDTNIVIDVIA